MLSFTHHGYPFSNLCPCFSGVHALRSETAHALTDSHTAVKTVGVAREAELADCETQTDPVREQTPKPVPAMEAVGIQAAVPLDESITGEYLVGVSAPLTDDGRSQVSDISDISSSSRYLDDLVHQLAEEVQSYELVVDEVVNTVTKRFSPRAEQSGNAEPTENEVAQKLSVFQTSLKQRRDRLAAIRKKDVSAYGLDRFFHFSQVFIWSDSALPMFCYRSTFVHRTDCYICLFSSVWVYQPWRYRPLFHCPVSNVHTSSCASFLTVLVISERLFPLLRCSIGHSFLRSLLPM